MLYIVSSFAGKRYDIIQCHYGDNGSLATLLKTAGYPAKLVTMFHGWDVRVALERDLHRYDRLFKMGDCFLSISSYNYQNLVKLGANPKKLLSHPVGIDLMRFSPKKKKSKPEASSPVIILTVARLAEEKGLEYGIKAIHKLIQMNPDLSVTYQIIGEGPLRITLKALVEELNLGQNICFLGEMNQTEIIQKMEEAHIFLLPSVHEALPVVLMEAQAMGLLVVATKVGSVFEALKEEESGYLVSPRDPDALTERIMYLIKHPGLWSNMRRAGRIFVEKHYDIQKLNRKLVEIYEGLLL
jgi:colanic acid/amylovoran biosynthesis glycosyltransferase